MDINEKMMMDLAEQMGFKRNAPPQKERDKMSNLADKYKGKSDQELIDEILKVKKTMKKDKAQFEKQMKTVKALRAMMNGEQRERLDKLIRLLESED
ncbi:MAG: hypothetical protein K0R19_2853 [Bacillota bacterium]|jgi:L-2-hydroxyglutarate oxidase LhgO|nr:hypothetical protein [Bacillota bacterium]